MKLNRKTFIVLIAFAAAALPGWIHPMQAARPNVIFLFADDMRPDAIRARGNPIIETPNLDRLMAEGTSFTRAITAYPICHVSRAEIFTGQSAFRSGYPYRSRTIPKETMLWPQAMTNAGYHAWYVGKWHTPGTAWNSGFTETSGLYSGGGGGKDARKTQYDYKDRPVTGYRGWTFKTDDNKPLPDKGIGLTPDISTLFADAAIELLKRKPDKPFFMQVNFTAPHDPLLKPPGFEKKYDPKKIPLPENFAPQHPFDHGNFNGRDEVILPHPRTPKDIREELAVYYAVVSHLDAQIGRIVDTLKKSGQYDNTIIIFSSDHGLAMGSHGLMGKQNQYEHSIGVPLILAGPGIRKNTRSSGQCYLRDLYPTICEMIGIPIPKTVQSTSLVPLLRGEKQEVHPFVIGYFTDTQRMIREGDWKMVWYPKRERYQLFNLKGDPYEVQSLDKSPAQIQRIAGMRNRLESWLRENRDPLFDGK